VVTASAVLYSQKFEIFAGSGFFRFFLAAWQPLLFWLILGNRTMEGSMNLLKHRGSVALAVAAMVLASSVYAFQASSLAASQLINPDELVKILQSAGDEKPLIIQVGFHVLYTQAHIPAAEYIGPASNESGLQQLRKRVGPLPRSKFIVIYCGCCPWSHCPNLKPADDALRAMGFSKVKVLYIADNFGTNWVDKGYPVAKGE
jgi:thiosulfate/3-mercaptopyruvate sulfurtransferase